MIVELDWHESGIGRRPNIEEICVWRLLHPLKNFLVSIVVVALQLHKADRSCYPKLGPGVAKKIWWLIERSAKWRMFLRSIATLPRLDFPTHLEFYFNIFHFLLSFCCYITISQCGNYIIFVSFRFYVKSILRIFETQKLPFFQFLGLWLLLIWSVSPFKKCQKFIKIKIQTL